MLAVLPDTSAGPAVRDIFKKIALDINNLVREIKGIAHSLFPTALTLLGLPQTLRQLVSNTETTSTSITFSTYGLADDLIEPAASLTFYRVAQVSLDNVIKHARAKIASVRLENNDAYTRLIISDDGIGFDASRLQRANQGMGLRNMKERMEELDGTLEIKSSSEGTTIVATLPKTSRPPTS